LARQLTIIIPTYNEAENLPIISSALFLLPGLQANLIIVDDNSPDGTGNVAEDLAANYPGRLNIIHRSGKLGLGTAYIEGFQKALKDGAEVIAQMDADFSHPPEKMVELMQALETCDIAMGSRYVPGGKLDERWPLWRKGLSAFGNIYARTILRLPMHDVTGGFRAWRREALLEIPLTRVRSNGYAFQVEMAYLGYRNGCSFKEIPIYFADRRWGQSKMSFRIQAEAAVRVWQMLSAYRDIPGRKTVG
jgi:dolichol-phosphate mannosyltransferase